MIFPFSFWQNINTTPYARKLNPSNETVYPDSITFPECTDWNGGNPYVLDCISCRNSLDSIEVGETLFAFSITEMFPCFGGNASTIFTFNNKRFQASFAFSRALCSDSAHDYYDITRMSDVIEN